MIPQVNPLAKFKEKARHAHMDSDAECHEPAKLVSIELEKNSRGTLMIIAKVKLKNGCQRKAFFPIPAKIPSLEKAFSALGMASFDRFMESDGLDEFDRQAREVRGKTCYYVVRHKKDSSGKLHVNREIHAFP